MDHWRNHQSSIISRRFPLRSIGLLISILCCATTAPRAGAAARSQPVSSGRAAQSAKPAASQPGQASTAGSGASPTSTMETNAAAEFARNRVSTLARLVAQTKGQEGESSADARRGGSSGKELWSSRIAAPDASAEAESSLALKRLIRQVHSLTTGEKKPAQLPELAAQPAPKAQPPAPAPISTDAPSIEPTETPTVAAAPAETTPKLSLVTQKTLDALRKEPSRVQDPLEVAELLFLSGRPADATPFYEEALRHTRAGDAACASDRAWILFQLGNCLRETDMVKAQEAYVRLIAEYPDSPWTEMARAGGRYLTWYQSTRPDQLMRVSKP